MRLHPTYSFLYSCQLVMTVVFPKAKKLDNTVSFSSVQARPFPAERGSQSSRVQGTFFNRENI